MDRGREGAKNPPLLPKKKKIKKKEEEANQDRACFDWSIIDMVFHKYLERCFFELSGWLCP
jgi:hypothetical protein